MAKYNNLQQLYSYLQNRVRDTLKDEVATKVKEVESSAIQNEVYNSYIPVNYDRREEDGGLSDINNMVDRVSKDGDGFKLIVRNKTKPNRENENWDNQVLDLAGLIEYGHGNGYGVYKYTHKQYSYLKPRPFEEETRTQLNSSKSHVNALKTGLLKRKINII